MSISMKQADRSGSKRGSDERFLPVSWANKEDGTKNVSGKYICKVLDIRQNDTEQYGLGFFMDLEISKVIQGNSKRGTTDSYVKFPDNVVGHKKMPKAKARARELGKIQIAVAAALGRTASEADFVDDERYAASLSPGEGQKSPLAGSYVLIEAVPYVGQKGPTTYYEVFPAAEEDIADLDKAAEQPPKAAPAIEKKAAPSLVKKAAPFPPAPWAIHPEDSEVVWNEETGDMMSTEELRAQLAA